MLRRGKSEVFQRSLESTTPCGSQGTPDAARSEWPLCCDPESDRNVLLMLSPMRGPSAQPEPERRGRRAVRAAFASERPHAWPFTVEGSTFSLKRLAVLAQPSAVVERCQQVVQSESADSLIRWSVDCSPDRRAIDKHSSRSVLEGHDPENRGLRVHLRVPPAMKAMLRVKS